MQNVVRPTTKTNNVLFVVAKERAVKCKTAAGVREVCPIHKLVMRVLKILLRLPPLGRLANPVGKIGGGIPAGIGGKCADVSAEVHDLILGVRYAAEV